MRTVQKFVNELGRFAMAFESNIEEAATLFPTETAAMIIEESFRSREISINGVVLKTTPAFDAYWYFATARQDIFHERVSGVGKITNFPTDEILRSYRFTNAYRASDRVSQYLIQDVILKHQETLSDDDLFFRILLFKLFNKIETWEAINNHFRSITLANFDFDECDRLLSDRQNAGFRNYSAAYIMPSAGSVFGHKRKHSNHLALIRWMLEQRFPSSLRGMTTMSKGYDLMLSAPSLGPFLAYQFITDINYSSLTSFSEMEFVVAGPGAHDGISKCFETTDGVSAEEIIKYMAENQSAYFSELGHEFNDLWGRPLQLIDCQNLFCEISKYTRVAFPEIQGVAGRTRIKQKYQSSRRSDFSPRYPSKWGIVVPSIAPEDQGANPHLESSDYRNQGNLFETISL